MTTSSLFSSYVCSESTSCNIILDGSFVLVLVVTIFPIIDGPKLQVKNLLSIHPEDEVPVKNVTIRRIPRYFVEILEPNIE